MASAYLALSMSFPVVSVEELGMELGKGVVAEVAATLPGFL